MVPGLELGPVRLAAWAFVGWCGWRWAVTHPGLALRFGHRLIELGWFVALLFLVMVIYKKVNRLPVVW